MIRRRVFYMAHPVSPLPDEVAADTMHPTPVAAAVDRNIKRALRWLRWLRHSFPHVTFVAPWVAGLLSGEDDGDPAQREAGLVDCEATAALLDGVVLVGWRISSGMARERAANLVSCDLTRLGAEPPDQDYDQDLHGPVPELMQ